MRSSPDHESATRSAPPEIGPRAAAEGDAAPSETEAGKKERSRHRRRAKRKREKREAGRGKKRERAGQAEITSLGRLEKLSPLPPAPAPPAEPIFPVNLPASQKPGEPIRGRRRFRSALFFVVLPTLAAALYYGHYASDQYYAKADFAIRTQNPTPTEGMSVMGFGASGSPAVADMFIVRNYIHSRQILEDLKPRIDLRAVYDTPDADWLARLPSDATEEELLEYWKHMVTVKYDATTGITHLGVRAFSAENAKLVADNILDLGEELVNRLSERAQADSVALAKSDVEAAFRRVTETIDALQSFQKEARQVDPASFVLARSEIQAKLEAEISQYESQLQQLQRALPDDAPSVAQLMKRLDITRAQLAAEKLRSTESPLGDGQSASEVITRFNKLQLETEFATKAYDSALASLETARVEAAAQDRYLEAFVRPQAPQEAEYPWRVLNVVLIGLTCFVVWGIGRLVIAAISEHV